MGASPMKVEDSRAAYKHLNLRFSLEVRADGYAPLMRDAGQFRHTSPRLSNQRTTSNWSRLLTAFESACQYSR
jgi:hypothetical protein